MKKLKLSPFDLGIIIAFVVLTIIGGGACWYFWDGLAAAQQNVSDSKAKFDKVSSNPKFRVVVSAGNLKVLQANIDLLEAQVNPVLLAKFLSKDNKLNAISNEDPVAWKHDLDDTVHSLNTEAKTHNVGVPANFYFGFSQYLSVNPRDDQTAVLTKQLDGIDQIATALIDAPVKSIQAIRRTYEEDTNTSSTSGAGESDRLGGHSLTEAGNIYTAYPFEVVFQTTSENLRTVVKGLMNSPYVFVIRTIAIHNTVPNSPQEGDLDKMAGPAPQATSISDSSPGEVAAAPPTKGPQFLFGGDSLLVVTMRVDMIQWNAGLLETDTNPGVAKGGAGNTHRNPSTPGGK